MPRRPRTHARAVVSCWLAAAALLLCAVPAAAQHHGYRSSPATAPPPPVQAAPPAPAAPPVAVSSGLGMIQFTQANYSVPAPQALTRQLRFDDERTRAAALSALGVPAQYLQRGRIPYPHSIELRFAELGVNEDVDALLTVELDEHIVTAVLVPVDGNWKRIATLVFPTAYTDPATTPDTWLQMERSLVQRDRYRAVFRGSSGSMRAGNFAENEAHVRVLNGKAVVTISFASTERSCTDDATVPQPPHARHRGSCSLVERWLQAEPADPWKRFELVTGSGQLLPADLGSDLFARREFESSRLRAFTCQPFVFSDSDERYEPTGPATPCRMR